MIISEFLTFPAVWKMVDIKSFMTDNCDVYSGMLITVITGFTQLSDNIKWVELRPNTTDFHVVCEVKAWKCVLKAPEPRVSTIQATVQHVSIIKLQIHLYSCTILAVTSKSQVLFLPKDSFLAFAINESLNASLRHILSSHS